MLAFIVRLLIDLVVDGVLRAVLGVPWPGEKGECDASD